ncbi:MAG: S46 family peptidase [Bacteroidales bacterium]|nr:S46 family peptidase [Bacteroidales bacterium]
MNTIIRTLSLWLFASVLLLAAPIAKAGTPDEGMWLPMFVERLNYVDMQKMGLKLTPEELYSINNSSLKDAIVGLASGSAPYGYFCTGEIVSNQGLMFTNHHCGYNNLQEHSSVEHDYLTNGFWAMSFEEELPNPGLTASFLHRMEDVTQQIVSQLSDTMSEATRAAKIQEISEEIQEKAKEGGKYDPVVHSFFGGNEFYLFVYVTYRDVRLVGAPPSSIGKFGGDTDNWMWPRHTGDFCIFRVYSAPDGSPAAYNKENVPLKPRHHLPVSLKGVQKDDYAMIWGYPGSTDRYLSSYGVEQAINESNPTTVKIRDKKLALMKEDMNSDPRINIMYAAKHAGTANYWKYYIGQTRMLKRLKVADKKRATEAEFLKWVEQSPERKAKYGDALKLIADGYDQLKLTNLTSVYLSEAVFQGPEIIFFAMRTGGMAATLEALKKAKKEEKAKLVEKLQKTIEGQKRRAADFYKDFNMPTDRKQFAGLMEMYYNNVPADQRPAVFGQLEGKFKGDFKAWANYLYEKSLFASREKFEAFLADPDYKTLTRDPFFDMATKFRLSIMSINAMQEPAQEKIGKGNRLFIDALRQMYPDRKFAPDANSTMRVSYGSVQDYYPGNAMHYDLITTLDGVMEKEDPSNDEFVVDPKLKALWEKKDFGRYGIEINGEKQLVTCFLTTNDITGGNSGSPVINGNGELIGLAFDGNWEAMSGDIAFEPQLQRTICADVRYVLFVIEKIGECNRLINEMTLVE